MKILLIFNPQAGHGRAKDKLTKVVNYFKEKSLEIELKLTDYPNNACEIVRDADLSKYDGLVACGGDGTLYEVINGYYQNKGEKKIPIGIVPLGTGNAFARDLGLTNILWKESIDIIANQKTRLVDVGKYKCEGKNFYFLNILGLGFVTDVSETARKLKAFGNISYTFGVLFRTIFLKTDLLNFEIDEKKFERECTFVEISNTRYTANFLMAPDAEIDDGFLDVIIASKLSRIKLLQSFPKIFTGKHIEMPEIEVFKAKKLKINSSTKKLLAPDGELLGSTPVEIYCLQKDIEVFWK